MTDNMKQAKQETHTLQVWPSGRGYEYRGDPAGPAEQRQLRARIYSAGASSSPERWRDGQPDEWREIVHEVRALMYQDRDVLCCDSALVDDLIKQSDNLWSDLRRAFDRDEIHNLYPNMDEMTMEACREWLSDHGMSEPEPNPWTLTRDEMIELFDDDGAREDVSTFDDDKLRAEVIEGIDDETIKGLDDWRTAIRDNAKPAEVCEWWRVSSWLCDQLHVIGEVTIDNGYGRWWGRCATGQHYIMDGVLQRVAAQFD